MLVNFTAYSDSSKVGLYMDASSKQWTQGKTIAIFVLPSVVPPQMVYNGSHYTVDEDSKGEKGFNVSKKLYTSHIDKKREGN